MKQPQRLIMKRSGRFKKPCQNFKKAGQPLLLPIAYPTVQAADQILVLQEGCLAEQGTHDALITQDGIYARMYSAGLHE